MSSSTVLITHPDCLGHETPQGHPEQIARLEVLLKALERLPVEVLSAPLAQEADLLSVHPQHYLDALRAASPAHGSAALDADTHLSAGSLKAAYRAAGGVLLAVDQVLSGAAQNAFVATRPPGHHAETAKAMGFCLFGNAALGAKYALDRYGLQRVAVVDFDVHHGNGTQDLLWDEPRALFVSSHQMPLYPGSGAVHERGASDNVLNLPLPPGSDGQAMRSRYTSHVFPRLREWQPELILISAGFDAHTRDPLANLLWENEDFAWVTRELVSVAEEVCEGRIVSTLEGGYDLQGLGEGVLAHVTELEDRDD